MTTLHLIPVELSDTDISNWLPQQVKEQAAKLTFYIAENAKTARAFLKKIETQTPIQEITIYTLSAKTSDQAIDEWLNSVPADCDIGLVSEAGCPAVADPGSRVVARAHQRDMQIVPHTGPNSIVLGLMGSGLNGQSFAFHGYAPIKPEQRGKQLKQWESISHKIKQTQIMIETPYRNNAMLETLLETLRPSTQLCIARDLTGSQELIKTQSVAEWKKRQKPDLNKIPTLFLFLA